MQIISFTPESLSNIATMAVELWPDCNYDEEYENYKALLNSQAAEVFLAEEEGKYIGFIQLSLRTDYVEGTDSSPIGYIEGLYVKPEYRKKDVARKLVERGEEWSKEKGCTQYASDVVIENTNSIEFHKRIGFEEVGRTVHFLREIK